MANEIGSISIQPSHQADLLVTEVELRQQDPVWMVKVKARTFTEPREGSNDGHIPDVSIHYYCESHLAPRPGTYIHIYVEGQKTGIPHTEEE